MTIKAIIFDMDGVLIDAKEWHYQALNRALALFGYEINYADHLMNFDGLPTKMKLNILSNKEKFPTGLHSFINDLKQQYTMELIHTQCRPNFPHEYALSKLKKMGIKMAVASNSIRATVDAMLLHANLEQYFEFSLSNQDIDKPKPNPEIYTTAINKLQLKATECLILEDNENGIQAATASGAHLLRIGNIEDVNLTNILNRIREVEKSIC